MNPLSELTAEKPMEFNLLELLKELDQRDLAITIERTGVEYKWMVIVKNMENEIEYDGSDMDLSVAINEALDCYLYENPDKF